MEGMESRWADWVRVDALAPALRNPKDHDLLLLAASVDRFGFVEPVVVDERTGRLLGGHGRVEFLLDRRAAGGQPPEGVAVDDDGHWRVLTLRGVRTRDDTEAEALGVALNRVGEKGGWLPDVLTDTLETIRETEPDTFDATGFTHQELDDLIDYTDHGDYTDALPLDPTETLNRLTETLNRLRADPDQNADYHTGFNDALTAAHNAIHAVQQIVGLQ